MDLRPDVIQTPLICLNRFGLSPTNKNFYKKILGVCSRLSSLILFILCFLNFVFNEVNKYTFPRMLEGQVSMGQTLIRHFILCFCKKKFLGLLEQRETFWGVKGLPLALKKKIEKSLKVTYLAYKTFYKIAWGCCFFMIVTPWYFQEFCFDCWNPENAVLNYTTISVLQGVLVLSSVSLIVGFDSLYMGLTASVIVQFQILRYHMEKMDWSSKEYVRKMVGHHEFLINFTRQLIEMYSILFFTQFFSTTLTVVLELYNSTDSNVQVALLLKNTAYNICLLIQLVFYFVPASEVTYQAEGISQAIYQSGWLYKLDRDMKIKALMIMRRARKPLVFTALGFAPINMETFTAIFKAGISCLTMMKQLRNG